MKAKLRPRLSAGSGGSVPGGAKRLSSSLKYKVATAAAGEGETADKGPESAPVRLDCNGFSHLEWSASVPYNLAEEPDEVRGMKHSHSCQSMPSSAQLLQQHQAKMMSAVSETAASKDDDDVDASSKSMSDKAKCERVVGNNLDSNKAVGGDDSTCCSSPSDDTNPASTISDSAAGCCSIGGGGGNAGISSSSSLVPSSDSSSATKTKEEAEKKAVAAKEEEEEAKRRQQLKESQDALSKKLEELRVQNRSTVREGLMLSQQRHQVTSF